MASRTVPRIGITTYREIARWGVWEERADVLPEAYARSVEDAGGLPVLLPPAAAELAPVALGALDGLVVAGGADVDPARYGCDRDPRCGAARPDRDAWELALVLAALDAGTALLAICRGMQVLNVALGGTLIQDLPQQLGTDLHSPAPGRYGRHRVDIEPGCRLARALGRSADVATHHHQALDRVAAGLAVTARAEDGVVEAVELTAGPWAVGVQWHPETHRRADGAGADPLFVALADAALAGVPA